jgi:hypothetical protein
MMAQSFPSPLSSRAGLGRAVAIGVTLIVCLALPVQAQPEVLRVEVAEIGSRFRVDDQHVDANGIPTRGNAFLAEGYIYPAGTLSCEGFACNGVTYDAAGTPSPEFPDLVIGSWICSGTHLEDIAQPTERPISLTTQLFDLGDRRGETTIVTTGFEIATQGVPVDRAITGGTGVYAAAVGVHSQTFLGFNNVDLFHDGQPWSGITLAMELVPR